MIKVTADLHLEFDSTNSKWTAMCLNATGVGATPILAVSELSLLLKGHEVDLNMVVSPKSNHTLLEVRRFQSQT
jgi:hypothetical protein